MKSIPGLWLDGVGLLAAAAAVAALAPEPWWPTDRGLYEDVARKGVVPGCADLHCFRPLVPWALGRIPGPPVLIWKSYAVICQAAAGIMMAFWVRRWGVNSSTARMVAWLTTLGSGACYTLFDPFTADPLMHVVTPTLMLLLDTRMVAAATAISAITVLAKEMAAVPLVIGLVYRALTGAWEQARPLLIGVTVVLSTWTAWQIFARTALGYTTGSSYSDDFLGGSFVIVWLEILSLNLVLVLLAMTLGGAWVLWAAGLVAGPPALRQLTFAALPAMLIFNAVQQPDRALWNFAFIVMPAVAVVLNRAPAALGWTFVAAQVLLNVRFGAQLPQAPPARLTFFAAAVLAAALVWRGRARAAAATA
jgi:hypothetical protein